MAIATAALVVIQSANLAVARSSVAWTLLLAASVAVLCAASYVALAFCDQTLAPARRRLITSATLLALAANTAVNIALLIPHLTELNRYSMDAGAATDCATQQFLQEHDPYATVHMLICLNSHGLAFDQSTPERAGAFSAYSTFPSGGASSARFESLLRDRFQQDLSREKHTPKLAPKEFVSQFGYPGGAILLGVAAWTVGVRDLVGLLIGAVLVSSYLIYRRAGAQVRLATALLLFGDAPLLLDSAKGATDILYATILVVYWQVRKRPLVAGLLLGLAAATRQQAWLFLPFMLYLGWRSGRWPDLRARSLAAVATFLACNLPFIVQSPGDWISGVLGPILDPLFAQGVGLVGLTAILFHQQLGPPILYLALVIAAYVFACRLFMRRWVSAPGLAMLLPILPLALSWRSMPTDFLVLPLLAMAVLTSLDPEDRLRAALHRRASRLRSV